MPFDFTPYNALIQALHYGRDTTAELEAIAALPLEARYAWHVAATIKAALQGFDPGLCKLDIGTLGVESQRQFAQFLGTDLSPEHTALLGMAILGEAAMHQLVANVTGAAGRVQ